MDNKYSSHRQKQYFAEYIEYNEFELALDSLIELSDESQDLFEYDFWVNIEQAAKQMNLVDHEKLIKERISEFWYDNAKRFKLAAPEIETTIYYLTAAEGGRSSFVYSGYRGTFFYDDQYNSTFQEFIGQVKCEPGETVRALISFVAPEAQNGRLYEGMKFKVTEGRKIVGLGEILRIMKQDLIKLG